MAVPWQAEAAPGSPPAGPQRPAGRPTSAWTRPGCAPPRGSGCSPAPAVPDGATPGGAGLRRPPVRRASPRGWATVARCSSASSSTATAPLRDLHLKGSGRTPFARGGDGLAAVGPMLREYVVSEAMHALGIPTTRSLAVVATGRRGAARGGSCPARSSPGWPAATCASGASSTPRPPATSRCCAASPTTRSPATTRRPPTPSVPTSRSSRRWSRPRRPWWPGGCWSASSTGS